jgi:hypothetical protein
MGGEGPRGGDCGRGGRGGDAGFVEVGHGGKAGNRTRAGESERLGRRRPGRCLARCDGGSGDGRGARLVTARPGARKVAIALVLALGLTGCGKSESFHYKLTLEVDKQDGGVASGSSVSEIGCHESALVKAVFPESGGVSGWMTGEAVYVDLGPGRPPLVALQATDLHRDKKDELWRGYYGGPRLDLLSQLFGQGPSDSICAMVEKLAAAQGSRELPRERLPDLVTFGDVNDPRSVIEVDPHDLGATLGGNVLLRKATIEITREPVTETIVQRLPWVKTMSMDPHRYESEAGRNPVYRKLFPWDFKR